MIEYKIEYKEDVPSPDAAPEDDYSYYALEGKYVCLSWCKDQTVATISFISGLPHDPDDAILHGVMAEITVDVLRELAGLIRHPRFIELLATIGSSTDDWPVRNGDFCAVPTDTEELIREPYYG